MRVILVNKFWYPRGGAEQVVLMTKELLESAGHSVALFGMRHPENIFEEDYFASQIDYDRFSFRAGWKTLYNYEAKKKLRDLIRSFRPDVIHFHNIYHQLSFSLLDAAYAERIPMIMTLHDYHWLSPNYRLFHHGNIDTRAGWQCFFHNCLEDYKKSLLGTLEWYGRSRKKYRNMIGQFICPSEFVAHQHRRADWDTHQLIVVPNPLSHGVGRREYINGNFVLFAGRLSAEKGVDVLLSAARFTPSISYVIMGDGPERQQLEIQAKTFGLMNVQFVGHLNGRERDYYFQHSRLVVVPSQWLENAPLVIGEAASFQKIVLGSRIGGIPEELPSDWLVTGTDPKVWATMIDHWYHRHNDEREKRGRIFAAVAATRHNPRTYVRNLEKIYDHAKIKYAL